MTFFGFPPLPFFHASDDFVLQPALRITLTLSSSLTDPYQVGLSSRETTHHTHLYKDGTFERVPGIVVGFPKSRRVRTRDRRRTSNPAKKSAKALETKHLLHGGTGRAVRVLNRRAVAQSLPMDMFAVLSKPRVSSSAFRPRAAHAHGSVG